MTKKGLGVFVCGIIFTITLLFIISAGGDEPKTEVGRYQIAVAGEVPMCFVVDTTTGVVKKAYSASLGGIRQMGIPFDQMKNE